MYFISPFISWWTFVLFQFLGHHEKCCEHLCEMFCMDVCFYFSWMYTHLEEKFLGYILICLTIIFTLTIIHIFNMLLLTIWGTAKLFSKMTAVFYILTSNGGSKFFTSKKNITGPSWCGSVDWAPACEPKGRWFDSQSGHMPELWARSAVRGGWEATTYWYFSPSLALSKNK